MPFGGQSQQRWGDNTIHQSEYIRDFQLTDLSGRVCHSGPTRGRGMLVLAFFRTDCPTSRFTAPYLQKLADAYKESGKLTVWGLSQNDREATQAFAKELGIGFPLLLDHDGYHAMNYGLTAVPAIFLVRPDGTVVQRIVGWNRRLINEISAQVAKFAEIETPAAIVADDDPAPAVIVA